jgi:hypothetical protein
MQQTLQVIRKLNKEEKDIEKLERLSVLEDLVAEAMLLKINGDT